jgi:hypothetical protein
MRRNAYEKKRAHRDTHKTIRFPDGGALHFPGGVIRPALRLLTIHATLTQACGRGTRAEREPRSPAGTG